MTGKCLFLCASFSLFLCGIAFTQNKSVSYTVIQKTGSVSMQTENGSWISVTKDMQLSPDVFIKTGLNATMTISDGVSSFSITQLKKGTLAALLNKPSKITIGEDAKKTDVVTEESKPVKGVATAATRANPPDDEEGNWAEEN